MRAWALGCFCSHISTRTFRRALTDRVAGQLRGDKECPFSDVTKSGRVWRKVPESDARSVDSDATIHKVPDLFFFFFFFSASPDDHYLEADLREGTYGDTAELVSPVMTSSMTSCLHFRFRVRPAATLSVCTLSVVNGNRFLDCSRWSRSSSGGGEGGEGEDRWATGQASLPPAAYPYAVVFRLRRGVVGGVASIDDVTKTDGSCS